jgi:hypothetical protein
VRALLAAADELDAIGRRDRAGAGESAAAGQTADIRRIGAALYETLTGRPGPAAGAGFPSSRGLPAVLDLVLRRALAPDPAFGYPRAGAFATDLRAAAAQMAVEMGGELAPAPAAAAVEDLPGVAPPRPNDHARRRRRRRSAVAVLASLLMVLVVAGIGGSLGGRGRGVVRTPAGAGPAPGAGWWVTTAPTAGLDPPAGTGPDPFGSFTTPQTELVSCPSTSFCAAVGTYTDAGGARRGLLDTFAGGTWTAVAAPVTGLVPAVDPSDPVASVRAVACPVPGWCAAVGSYRDLDGSTDALELTLEGGAWHAATLARVWSQGTPSRVTCPAAGECVAVGDDTAAGTIWTLHGDTWQAEVAPDAGLTPPASARAAPRLTDVSCPAPDRCVAVGLYYAQDGAESGLIETLAGGTWYPASAPPPAGIAPAEYALDVVSCPAPGDCVAMGGSGDRAGSLHTLIETLASGTWHGRLAPTRGVGLGGAGRHWEYVTSLACPAPGSCVATGWFYAAASGDELHSFVLTDAGGAWTSGSPVLTGLQPPVGRALDVVPLAVACGGVGSCAVVGSYDDDAGGRHGLLDTLTGRRWRAATAPVGALSPAAGRDPSQVLGAVSCPADGPCTALGSYTDAGGGIQGVLVRAPG